MDPLYPALLTLPSGVLRHWVEHGGMSRESQVDNIVKWCNDLVLGF